MKVFFFLAPLLSQLHSEIPSGKKLDGGRLPNVITTLLLYVFFVSSDSSSQLERDKKEKMKYSKPSIFAWLSLLKATAAEEACCFRFANTFLYYSWYTCVPSCILVDLLRCVRLVCVHRTVIERLPPGDIGTSVKPRLLLRKGFFETKTRSSQRRPRPPASSSVFLVAAEASSAPTSGSARASFFCGSVATATGLGKIHSVVVVAVAHKASQLLLPMFHAISGFLLSSQQSNNLVRKD